MRNSYLCPLKISALNIKLLEPLAQGASRFEKLLAPNFFSNDVCPSNCRASVLPFQKCVNSVSGFANCGIRHVTVPIATRILIANVRHIGLSNICVINLAYFKMQLCDVCGIAIKPQ